MLNVNGEPIPAWRFPAVSITSVADANPATAEREVVNAFARYGELVRSYVRTIMRDPAGAEDVTQEAFLRYLQELREGRPIHNAKAWLFRAAHNLALNRRRDDARLSPLEDPARYSGTAPKPSPLEESTRQRLREALQHLSPQEQRCIELRAEGLLYREIAQKLGIRISSVSNYMERGIGKLRQAVNT